MEIAICAIFKNEGPYLREWIAFHHALGFNSFYLYDNGSTDGGSAQLDFFASKKMVHLHNWPERPGQLTAYAHFYENYAKKVDWVAFIDIDEFIHPLKEDSIFPLLKRAGSHPAILLNWMDFGPGDHVRSPEGLVIENYTLRFPATHPVHKHVKTFARVSGLKGIGGAHICPLKGDPCNSQGATIKNEALSEVICVEPVVINHYYTKSEEDWGRKVERGRATVPDSEPQRKMEWFNEFKLRARVEDTEILRFAPQVRKILGA